MENPECANCILDCSACELKPHVSLIEEVRELTRQSEINLQLQREKEVKEQVEKKEF
jgi:hypothetical protein